MKPKRNGLTAEVETIDPKTAASYLKKNKNVRRSSRHRVSAYAAAMAANEWHLTGDSIKFDFDGNLVDGQNRLQAIIESRSTIPILVVRGATGDDVMDTGLTRSAGQLLGGRGYNYGSSIAAAARLWILWSLNGDLRQVRASQSSTGNRLYVDNSMLLDAVEAHSGLAKRVETLNIEFPRGGTISTSPSVMGWFQYATSFYDEEKAHDFTYKLYTGVQLDEMDPVHLLRDRLIANRISRTARIPQSTEIAFIIKTWNVFIGATPYDDSSKWSASQVVRFGYKESYPLIAGLEAPNIELLGMDAVPEVLDIKDHQARQRRKAANERNRKKRASSSH